jgi:hypothetical protein
LVCLENRPWQALRARPAPCGRGQVAAVGESGGGEWCPRGRTRVTQTCNHRGGETSCVQIVCLCARGCAHEHAAHWGQKLQTPVRRAEGQLAW